MHIVPTSLCYKHCSLDKMIKAQLYLDDLCTVTHICVSIRVSFADREKKKWFLFLHVLFASNKKELHVDIFTENVVSTLITTVNSSIVYTILVYIILFCILL